MKLAIRSALCAILLFIASSSIGLAASERDSLAYIECVRKLEVYKSIPLNDLLIETALSFVGKPYVASTLEVDDKESLIVNLREFDCTTFVESCMAIAESVKADKSYSSLKNALTNIRYRDGVIDGYTSRLHYMTDWIAANEKRGYLDNITSLIGGVDISTHIDYMSQHPDAYRHLKENKGNLDKTKEIEHSLNTLYPTYNIIPKNKISTIQKKIHDGDIIVFATEINGLDYTHIGIAYHSNGQLRFIHASLRANKVCIESRTLQEYCNGIKSCRGISVLRLIDKTDE